MKDDRASDDDGIRAEAVEIMEISEVTPAVRDADFTAEELAYARSKSDPQRRLAARLAAKRATVRILGGTLPLSSVEVLPARGGPPRLRLLADGLERLEALGAARLLLSLTHGRTHAAASVLALADLAGADESAAAKPSGEGEPRPEPARSWRQQAVRGSLWLVAAALVIGALVLLQLTYGPAGDTGPHPFNQDRNAVWLEHRWLERRHSSQEVGALFETLDSHGIRYAFPHLIPFDASGRLPPHDREQMRAFLLAARQTSPGLKVLPWVGGLRVGYRRTRVGTIDLADLRQRQSILAECRALVDEGFDGIHVNVEPVADGNLEFLALLRALRTAIGRERILSLSAIRPGPLAWPPLRNFFWTADYYARIAAVADQIVVMAYDTALPTSPAYRRYAAYAAASVTATLVRNGSRAKVLMGVPTYDGTGLMHRDEVENVSNAVFGIVAGLRGLGGGGTFEGVALYAHWTTDTEEWEEYERLWRGKALRLR